MKRFLLLAAALMMTGLWAAAQDDDAALDDGMFAVFNTARGEIICRLYYDKTPLTVANFVSLAEGTMNYQVPGQDSGPDNGKKKPFYDGLNFHRVIKDFMIQGGCPYGKGTGGPGYKFRDEFDPTLRHDGPGVLSMANSGPATNGSQFFITHKATNWLDGKHTIFGRVVKGQDVVDAVEKDDQLNSVRIIRNGEAAKAFKTGQAAYDELLTNLYPGMSKTDSGIRYKVVKAGTGAKPEPGQTCSVHYVGTLASGQRFDSSRERNQPFKFAVGAGRVIKGWDEMVADMQVGELRTVVIPPELAYGAGGRGPIPANATLTFEIELLGIE